MPRKPQRPLYVLYYGGPIGVPPALGRQAVGSATEVLEPAALQREIAEVRKLAALGEEIWHGGRAAHGALTGGPQWLPGKGCTRRDRKSARAPLGEAR